MERPDPADAAPLGEVTAPVWLTIGDPTTGAEPVRLGDIRVAMHVQILDDGAWQAVSTDPDAVRCAVAALLEQHAAELRNTIEGQEVTGDGTAPR